MNIVLTALRRRSEAEKAGQLIGPPNLHMPQSLPHTEAAVSAFDREAAS